MIGRKNFLFANTPTGVQGSAVIYSLIETAKETGLDPYRYLVWVLEQSPRLSMEYERGQKALRSLAVSAIMEKPLDSGARRQRSLWIARGMTAQNF